MNKDMMTPADRIAVWKVSLKRLTAERAEIDKKIEVVQALIASAENPATPPAAEATDASASGSRK